MGSAPRGRHQTLCGKTRDIRDVITYSWGWWGGVGGGGEPETSPTPGWGVGGGGGEPETAPTSAGKRETPPTPWGARETSQTPRGTAKGKDHDFVRVIESAFEAVRGRRDDWYDERAHSRLKQ